MFSNQDFCYWLQGYFEISLQPVSLNKNQAQVIEQRLHQVTEPLLPLLSWLLEVCEYFRLQEYKSETLDFFLPRIQDSLANIFLHVIDESYESDTSLEERHKIHQGKSNNDQ